jgi:GNAT superfamily N-acetyltransferase
MLSFQRERIQDCWQDIEPLVAGHWDEVTDHEWPVDVDWPMFFKLEDTGIVRLMTARDGERVVGYVLFILAPALHYRSKLLAHDDAFYLHPEYRKGGAGFALFRAAEDMLREDHVDRIICHEKLKVPLEAFFTRLGFHAAERNWFKDLS